MLLAMVACFCATAASGSPPHIVLDPGHGGFQEGAVSDDGMPEKVLSLQIARRLEEALEKQLGAKVSLTRTTDAVMPLSERVTFANCEKPDLFISIHANSMPTKRQRQRIDGIETFFLSADASGEEAQRTAAQENSEAARAGMSRTSDPLSFILADLARSEAHADSSRLAYAVHQAVVKSTGGTDRGVQQAPLYVLTGVEAPAILVEVGFISHPDEGKRLQQVAYQRRIAEGIADGVKAFLGQMTKVTGRETIADRARR
jgi:N-acetylmuramoyl-L-alanine amidase